MFFVGFIPEV